jgi:DNA topoisomerase-3
MKLYKLVLFGHLVQLAMPKEYGFRGFIRKNLPIIPETFKLILPQVKNDWKYKPDAGALWQLKVVHLATN